MSLAAMLPRALEGIMTEIDFACFNYGCQAGQAAVTHPDRLSCCLIEVYRLVKAAVQCQGAGEGRGFEIGDAGDAGATKLDGARGLPVGRRAPVSTPARTCLPVSRLARLAASSISATPMHRSTGARAGSACPASFIFPLLGRGTRPGVVIAVLLLSTQRLSSRPPLLLAPGNNPRPQPQATNLRSRKIQANTR
jgi:hypothetical protein